MYGGRVSRRTIFYVGLVLLTAIGGLPGAASAQATEPNVDAASGESPSSDGSGDLNEDDARAATHFRAATSYFTEERFEKALEEFKEAYRLSRRPQMLYNIGLTLERLGRWSEAAEAHEEFLELAPADPQAEAARERLTRSRDRAQREASTGSGDPVVEPAARVSDATARVSAAPAPRPEDGGPSVAPLAVGGWVVGGASVAFGVVSLVTGMVAHGIHRDLEARCPAGVCPADAEVDADRGRRLARTSTAFTFLAAAGAVTAVVLFIVGGDSDDDGDLARPGGARLRVDATPLPGGGFAAAMATF